MAQMVKNLPAVLKTGVQSLGQEDTLEKGMATHSSILAWRIPWTEEPSGLQSIESLSHVRLFVLDCSPPGSSVHGISQARILEWVAIPFCRGSSPTQGSNPGLLHCRQILHYLSHPGGRQFRQRIPVVGTQSRIDWSSSYISLCPHTWDLGFPIKDCQF